MVHLGFEMKDLNDIGRFWDELVGEVSKEILVSKNAK